MFCKEIKKGPDLDTSYGRKVDQEEPAILKKRDDVHVDEEQANDLEKLNGRTSSKLGLDAAKPIEWVHCSVGRVNLNSFVYLPSSTKGIIYHIIQAINNFNVNTALSSGKCHENRSQVDKICVQIAVHRILQKLYSIDNI